MTKKGKIRDICEKIDGDVTDGVNVIPNDKIPQPFSYHVLIQPMINLTKTDDGEYKSDGGVYLPEEVEDNELYKNSCGWVIAVGSIAFCDRDTGEPLPGEYPKVGDLVYYSRNRAGLRFPINGIDVFSIKDDYIEMLMHPDMSVDQHYRSQNKRNKKENK